MLFNAAGLGVLSVQLCIYYLSFPQDSVRFKTLVYTVYMAELAQTVLLCNSLFRSFVYGFFEHSILDRIGDLWFSIPVLGGIVSFLVQVFYAYRIVALGSIRRNAGVKIVATIVTMFAIIQLGGGLALGILLKEAVTFSRIKNTKVRVSAAAWYAGEAIGDILIAIFMTLILLRTGSEGTKSTRKLTRKLIRLTIETGTLTATMAIVTIILVMFGGSYYQVTAGVVSKLYSNTLLASLNGRTEAAIGLQDDCYDAGPNSMSISFELPTIYQSAVGNGIDMDCDDNRAPTRSAAPKLKRKVK
ncbi:hypothetical protein JR316_0006455 [Psilocybe cubensis]|uniref:Uncharacterized protein n=2 Tax=Psilocybe cubensis TaxID=181762 RepID=A0ACB8H406_PSICU|nr:hypothetical protein JR316_0006455 [Psilocybe cubensis]KAH9481925.1 hypothetical protein JR316_0006455 [Psilocybe cubensis]